MSLVSSYKSPYVYEVDIPRIPTLAGFNFTVTDVSTRLPIQNARCNIHAGLDGTGDTDGGYTDANGIFGIDAKWFVPRSWSVYKEGYIRQISNYVTSQIPVALEPTTIIYTVNILAGTGGYTVPSGFIQVEPNTELTVTAYPSMGYVFDYWVYKGANAGSDNPLAFLIDRDAITIAAVFKVVEEPPPNGPPPNGDGWVVTKPVHIFDDVKLKAEWHDISKSMSRTIINIDTSVLVGSRLDYTVKYTQGLPIAETAKIAIDYMNIVSESLSKGESKSGSVDLTGLIGRDTTITISFDSAPGIWSEVLFDVWVTFGYSEEPATDPKLPLTWREILDKYGTWIALSTVGIIVLYMIKKPAMPIIVIPGGKK